MMVGGNIYLLTVITTLAHTLVVAFDKTDIYEKPIPPGMRSDERLIEGLRGQEAFTNLTIDEIILKAMHKELRSAGILYRGDFVQAEMDMILPRRMFLNLYGISARLQGAGRKKRRSLRDSTLRWPNAEGAGREKRRSLRDSTLRWPNAEGARREKRRTLRDSTLRWPNAEGARREKRRTLRDSTLRWPNAEGARREKRRTLRDSTLRWLNAEVPYYIEPGHFEEYDMFWLNRSMTEWERYSCVKFIPAQKQHKNFVSFQSGDGCYSHVGMSGGKQVVSLGRPDCRKKAIYLHMIGHVLGLVHEHLTPKRQRYLKIKFANVHQNWRKWLRKYSKGSLNKFRLKYDPVSIMHFGSKLYSKDGESTTVRLRNSQRSITLGKVWRHELSFSDVKLINMLYKCDSKCPKSIVCLNGGFVTESCDCLCPDSTGDCRQGKQPTKETGRDCKNALQTDWSCSVWARQGECVRNEKWMRANCDRACNMCQENKSKTDLSLGTLGLALRAWNYEWRIPDKALCKDSLRKEKCRSWASRGDCITNPDWMKFHCRRACGLCRESDQTKVTCVNEHLDYGECDMWALDGECGMNESWMYTNCRRSCRMCNPDDRVGFAPIDREKSYDLEKVRCVDRSSTSECQAWVQRGECLGNELWMTYNCRKSCQRCDDGRCQNLYADKDCEKWKVELDECVKRPSWMRKFCRFSCGHCKLNTWEVTPQPYKPETPKKTQAESHNTVASGVARHEYRIVNEGDCSDIYGEIHCKRWAAAGHCHINESFLSINCRKSCGICAEIQELTDNGDCQDLVDDCAVWANGGYCTINPVVMMTSCRKSCNSCIGGCVDNHALCEMWSRYGYCSSTPGPMFIHCQKSCGVC